MLQWEGSAVRWWHISRRCNMARLRNSFECQGIFNLICMMHQCLLARDCMSQLSLGLSVGCIDDHDVVSA